MCTRVFAMPVRVCRGAERRKRRRLEGQVGPRRRNREALRQAPSPAGVAVRSEQGGTDLQVFPPWGWGAAERTLHQRFPNCFIKVNLI